MCKCDACDAWLAASHSVWLPLTCAHLLAQLKPPRAPVTASSGRMAGAWDEVMAGGLRFAGSVGRAYAQSLIAYYGSAFLLDSILPRLASPKSVQVAPQPSGQRLRDARRALTSNLVKACILAIAEELYHRGLNKMYGGPVSGVRAWLYLAACVVALDYLHDTWFYWTHRLLHWGPLMRRVHLMHHQSSIPTAYTGYSFHWVEAALVFANEIIVTFLFPIHHRLHRAYHLFATVIHNGGHCGYELAPFVPTLAGLAALVIGRGKPHPGLNTVQHHDMHHRFPNKHFSLYFTHWDRWMSTMHPAYDAMVHSATHGAPTLAEFQTKAERGAAGGDKASEGASDRVSDAAESGSESTCSVSGGNSPRGVRAGAGAAAGVAPWGGGVDGGLQGRGEDVGGEGGRAARGLRRRGEGEPDVMVS